MLRGNLSTRPFYNDRLMTLTLAAVAAVVLLLTIVNVTQLLSLSDRWTGVQAGLTATREQTAAIRARTAAEQQGLDRGTLLQLSASTEEANRLIEARTFSWTALLGLLERAMPMDVRLVSVSPGVDSPDLTVDMTIAARALFDVDMFVDALQETGAFYDVTPSTIQADENGMVVAQVVASYLGAAKDGVTPDGPPGPPAGSRTPAAPAGGRP